MVTEIGHLQHLFWNFVAQLLKVIDVPMVVSYLSVLQRNDTSAKCSNAKLSVAEQPYSLIG